MRILRHPFVDRILLPCSLVGLSVASAADDYGWGLVAALVWLVSVNALYNALSDRNK